VDAAEILELTDVSHPESGVVVATAVDTVADITHRQPFVAFEVDDERLAYLANRVGLRVDGYVHEAPSWVKLVLTTRRPSTTAESLDSNR